ncbi:long-chain-alcohol oxidase FAO2-like [Wolffia australiana]
MEEEKKIEYHPILRGGRWPRDGHPHGFSDAEMETLAALCEALIPPLKVEELNLVENKEDTISKSLQAFWEASGAEPPLPDETAQRILKGPSDATFLIRAVLWALSTRLGTLVLCGSACTSSKFPFVQRLSDLSLRRREALLQKWSRESCFWLLRIVFVIIKINCFATFFTKCDNNSESPFWEAIEYSLPPRISSPQRERPLEKGIIELRKETDVSLIKSLTLKGLTVKVDEEGVIGVDCDVVIVGSGCGGSVAAAVLAAAGHKVIVLEKGDYHVAADFTGNEGPSYSALYEEEGNLGTLDGKLMLLAGSAVGGGSIVNWAACIKTPAHVMAEWAEERRLPLFGSPEYISAMEEVWKRIGVTENCLEESSQNKILRLGCDGLGLKVESVARNSPEGHFCGSCGLGCPTGEKRATDKNWLVDAVNHNAVILSGCKAEKFLLQKNNNKNKNKKKKKCVGVAAKAVAGEVRKQLRIRAKVSISSGGALRTPVLLSASGLKNRHIGKNLHLHPAIMPWGYFPDVQGKMQEGGILTAVHKMEGGKVIIETPTLGPGAYSILMPWTSGKDMKETMRRYNRTAHFIVLARDKSTGVVEGERRISYTLEKSDEEELRGGLRRALRIFAAAGAAEVGTHRSDGQRVKCKGMTDDEMEEFLDRVELPAGPGSGSPLWAIYGSAHQMGSCRMGAEEDDGAVDEAGESWEAEGLFVIDASLFPTALGVNPMITIQSLALCLSKRLAHSMATPTQ